MKENEMDLALEDYQFVLNNSRAAFRESSLLKSARIYRVKKQFYKALKNYKELFQIASNEIYISESLDGQLECFHQLGQSDSVLVVGKNHFNFQYCSGIHSKKGSCIYGKCCFKNR
jgi:lipopolysaccharide biosynthesis regulator YciM